MLLLSPEPLVTEADYRACAEAIRTGSRSFYTASWLLPAAVRRSAYALYAFCRLSDDAIDLDGARFDALQRLQARLDRAYAGRPADHFADRAMADLVHVHRIPREIPEALLDGLGWDCAGRRYRTIEDLHGYCARVAATVGVMMTLLMGARDAPTLARACDLGVAMQLSNIARDIGEDAREGRIYLPLDWLEEEGVDVPAFLADPEPTPALRRVVARLLGEADRLYARSREGVARLPLACRPAILAASAIYAEIGCEVARRGCDSVTSRARVSGMRKLALLGGACVGSIALGEREPEPALAAAAFLVEAVARRREPVHEPYSLGAHAGRVLAMFERLQRAQMVRD